MWLTGLLYIMCYQLCLDSLASKSHRVVSGWTEAFRSFTWIKVAIIKYQKYSNANVYFSKSTKVQQNVLKLSSVKVMQNGPYQHI